MSKSKYCLLVVLAIIVTLIVAAIVIINVDKISDPYQNERLIDKQSFKGQWPFTVEEGLLKCENIDQTKVLSFNALQGVTYSLNDVAHLYSTDKKFGWQPISTDNIQSSGTNINDVIKTGLELCEVE